MKCKTARLESVYTTKSYLGFESRSLRKKIPDPEARDFFVGKTHPLFMQAAEESCRQSHSEARPLGGILGVHRARFCRFFAPVGNLKMPPATLLRGNRGRWTPFHISTGRDLRNQHGFSVDAKNVHITHITTLPPLRHYTPKPREKKSNHLKIR